MMIFVANIPAQERITENKFSSEEQIITEQG